MDSSARSESRPAIVLLSGGLDSATVLAIAIREGFTVMALSFDYGQRHRIELDAARRIAASMNITDHVVLPFDLRPFGGSALTAADLDVPKHESVDEIGRGVPITYVPARNTVFLSLALALADARGILDIFIGINALDYSGYPDCRPEFIRAFEQVANLGTRAGDSGGRFHIHAPLIAMTKAQITQRGIELGVDYSLTISCYDPDGAGRACGHCDSCLLRRRGFEQAGVPDPTRYR